MPNTLRWAGVAVLIGALAGGCQEPLEQPGDYPANLQLTPTVETTAAPVPPIDQVRIRIGRPPAETVLDTTVAFPAGTAPLSLRLRVALKARSERLGVTVDLLSGGQVYYSGSDTVLVVALGSGPAAAPNLVLRYVGPGANIRSLRIAPRDSALTLGDPLNFRLTARDAQGVAVTGFPVTWSTTDLQVPVSQNGALVAPLRRVTIKVAVAIPTGLVDTVAITFVPKPVTLAPVSGGGQTGRTSSLLSVPFAVVVKAADSLPMAGVTVRFRTTAGGGSVRDSVVATNSQGQAATSISLGNLLGLNRYEATVQGLATVPITAVATAGPAARLVYQSGGGQIARVGATQAQPLVVLVTDSDGFPASGEKVSWSVVAGGGLVSANTSSTDAQGLASMTSTAGPLRGLTLVQAAIPVGPSSASVRFASFGRTGPAATLQIFSGDGGSPFFSNTLRVRLSDAQGNPVAAQTIGWTITQGLGFGSLNASATITGADGLASVNYDVVGTGSGPAGAGSRTSTTTGAVDVQIQATTAPSLSATFTLPELSNIQFQPIGGIDQTGRVGQLLGQPLSAILGGLQVVIAGATVTWQIREGGGSLSTTTSLTNSDGAASVRYTAGTRAGIARVEARRPASGLLANFSATIEPGDPTALLHASGDNQSALAGASPALPLRAVVVDAFNNPIPGVPVAWLALDGGTVGGSSTTDPFGVATTTVQLGPGLGPRRFQARYPDGLGPISVTFTVTAR